MSEDLKSGAHRLHSGAPWWLLQDAMQEQAAPVTGPIDVAIVGAGITGALVADALSAEGARVAVFDRRTPVTGSSAVSTGLLQYEIDQPLHALIDAIGEADAVRAYRMSWDAIDRLEGLAAGLGHSPDFRRKPSLYLASRRADRKELERELRARDKHGFPAEPLSRTDVTARFGLTSHGGLYTRQAGEVDPVGLARALLARAMTRGAALIPRTAVVGLRRSGTGFLLETGRGPVKVGQVVFALGYEMPPDLVSAQVKLHSTFALITEPAEDLGLWKGECLVWESARPYVYLRTTSDGRVICGGEDLPFKNPDARDALLAARARRLEKRLSKLLPGVQLQTAFTWSGTFAETRDGLPLIGPSSELHGAFVALGYGGNGITFGVIAADLLTEFLQGRASARDYRLFDPAR